jgi:hypothetical protein
VIALAVAAALALPPAGVLVPGRSLGGIELGTTQAEVRAAWGARFGRCRSCPLPTWYFTYRPFTQPGAAVEFRNGRVVSVYTVWRPRRWRTRNGLRLGDPAARITALFGPLRRHTCGEHYALTLRGRNAVTVFTVVDDRLWAFALSRPGRPVCR